MKKPTPPRKPPKRKDPKGNHCVEERHEHKHEHKRRKYVRSFKIRELRGGKKKMANDVKGIIAGQKGSFKAVAVPAGAAVTGVPAWASDNPLAVVTPAADGLTADVAVDITATGSFNLSVSSSNPDGSVAKGTVAVPVIPAPVQSFDIVQTA